MHRLSVLDRSPIKSGGTAVEAIRKSLELAPGGITVNAVSPGGIGHRATGLPRPAKATHLRVGSQILLGRFAAVRDVAGVVAFLASDAAEYITGQAINVSGGTIMH